MMDTDKLFHPGAAHEQFRHELKYVCPEGVLHLIRARIEPICQLDAHTTAAGTYQIRSVYFDDFRDTCLHENENGADPREKFRIRIYNGSDRHISLECKKKERYKTCKDSCPLTRQLCDKILAGTLASTDLSSDLLRKFYSRYSEDYLRPKVIVAYERTPFVYPAGNVRVTFDRNIGSSTDFDAFFQPYIPLRPILSIGKQILEVKYDQFLPDFLYSAMNLGSLQQTAFSKYYLCRKFTV